VSSDPRPLILTAEFHAPVQSRLQTLREGWYPPALNRVPAHLTLFHQLPGRALAEISHRLKTIAAHSPPLPARLAVVKRIEGGVILRVHSPDLEMLREDLADTLKGLLTLQDSQSPQFHVTIQNKADAASARACLDALERSFRPEDSFIERLSLWRYLDGPWDIIGRYPLRGRWRG
jgi:2'-5' RNA ligase